MINPVQFEKARQFIFRHGRLLDRQRFSYHFEGAPREGVLAAVAAYQNPDGGFGNGLELDLLCPASSPICTEVGLSLLCELKAGQTSTAERAEAWAMRVQREDGTLPHPIEEIQRYPHGKWWLNNDDIRVLALAGLLGRIGRGNETFFRRAEAYFNRERRPKPAMEIGVYHYPLHLYLRYAPGKEKRVEDLAYLKAAIPAMLEKEAWHCPLFFCSDYWRAPELDAATVEAEARRAVATLQEDGGVLLPKYAGLPWWRPVWTLELLLGLKDLGLWPQRDAGDASEACNGLTAFLRPT